MRQRIAIIVLGLFLGLAARAVVELYQHLQHRRAAPPPAATATPLSVKSEKAR